MSKGYCQPKSGPVTDPTQPSMTVSNNPADCSSAGNVWVNAPAFGLSPPDASWSHGAEKTIWVTELPDLPTATTGPSQPLQTTWLAWALMTATVFWDWDTTSQLLKMDTQECPDQTLDSLTIPTMLPTPQFKTTPKSPLTMLPYNWLWIPLNLEEPSKIDLTYSTFPQDQTEFQAWTESSTWTLEEERKPCTNLPSHWIWLCSPIFVRQSWRLHSLPMDWMWHQSRWKCWRRNWSNW